MNNQRERKNKSGGAVMPAILAVVFAISAAGEGIVSSPAASVIVLILTVILIFAAVFFVIKRLLKSAGLRGSAVKPAGKGKLSFNTDPAEEKVFTASGASKGPVVYNPRSAEELFQRDHEKRMGQLDVFLKNGIIDKKEYALLRQRYEKISYERN